MTDPIITYRGKAGTVEELARTLIVASVVHQGDQPMQWPLTPAGARSLGRALEWAVAVEEAHAAREANIAARMDLVQALSGEVNVSLTRAASLLAEARRTNVRSIVLLLLSAVFTLAGGVLWGLA